MIRIIADFWRRNRAEIVVTAVFLVCAFGFNVYRVQSDGVYYFSFLERILGVQDPETPSSVMRSTDYFFQAGCAYFNMPFYILGYALEHGLHRQVLMSGITIRQFFINLASNFYLVLSLILCVKILKCLNFNRIILPVLSILFSTSAYVVAVRMPSMSHTVDIFLNTLVIYLVLRYEEKAPYYMIFPGLMCVFASLVRYANGLLAFTMVVYLFMRKRPRHSVWFIGGGLAFSWLVPWTLTVYNGHSLRLFAIASDEILTKVSLIPRYTLKYLFHPLHGLFVWAPSAFLGVWGWEALGKRNKPLALCFAGYWIVFLMYYGMFFNWYAGWSFTNRYLVNHFCILTVGLAAFLDRKPAVFVWLVVLLTVYSLFVYVNWDLCIIEAEFGPIGDIVTAWMRGFSPSFMDKTVNVHTVLHRFGEYCRYKYLFSIR